MHEYEFRLVVCSESSFEPLLKNAFGTLKEQIIIYVKPNFRYRNRNLETKTVESAEAVYHDGIWFKWVHSIETRYNQWSKKTCQSFMHAVGNFQSPCTAERRVMAPLDSHAQLYTFRDSRNVYRLVFELEYGLFRKPITFVPQASLFERLSRYKYVYDRMRSFPSPPYHSDRSEILSRRSVTCIETLPKHPHYLFARKLDGVFGLVYSKCDRIKEKWEDCECVVRSNESLGDGLVFAAEKMSGGRVYLLDVYSVRGMKTAYWARRKILLEFLPRLKLPDGYSIQTYAADIKRLPPMPNTDGWIVHDVERDEIFKLKSAQSIDLVYRGGYFHLPNNRCIPYSGESQLVENSVYEISTVDGGVIRERLDRFTGNTERQLAKILKMGWYGPPIEKKKQKKKLK